MAVHYRAHGPAQYGRTDAATRCTKGEDKPAVGQCTSGDGLSRSTVGKVSSDKPFQPDPGKPAVRNDRGDRGDVGVFKARSAPRSYPTMVNRFTTNVQILRPDSRRSGTRSQTNREPTRTRRLPMLANRGTQTIAQTTVS